MPALRDDPDGAFAAEDHRQAGDKQKSLYGGQGNAGARPGGPTSGLDELAGVVASSGISSGLSNRRPTRPADYATPGATPAKSSRIALWATLALVALVAAGAAAWFFLSSSGTSGSMVSSPGIPPAPPPAGSGSTNTPVAPAGPHFLSLPLDYKRIVFVIDRGGSMGSALDAVKASLYESLGSLGSGREFQVIFWTAPGETDATEYAYPKTGTARGNAERVADVRKQMEDLSAAGSADVGPAFAEAMKRDPDAVVLVTAKDKSFLESPGFAKPILDARGGKATKVFTVDLTREGEGKAALTDLAGKTGGTYLHVNPAELK